MNDVFQLFQVAEVELTYRNNPDLSQRPQITTSQDAYQVLLNSWDENKIGFVEQAKVLLLNQANRVLGIYELSTGGVTGTVCDPRLIFMAALKTNASHIILAHNHPSENMQPSLADRALTEKITEAGKTLEITVLDHLIVSPSGYYSLSEEAQYERSALKPVL